MQTESMCGMEVAKAWFTQGRGGLEARVGGLGGVITKWQPNYSSFSSEGVITQRGEFILGPNLPVTIP